MSPISESAPQSTEESGGKHSVSTVTCPPQVGYALHSLGEENGAKERRGRGLSLEK